MTVNTVTVRGRKSHSNWLLSEVDNFSQIVASKRYWGMAEGAVYAIPRDRGLTMIDCKKNDPGLIVWTEQPRSLFKLHPGYLFVANFKRQLHQHKADFGDIEILESRRIGKVLIVTRARVVAHQGQPKWLALARLRLRQSIEGVFIGVAALWAGVFFQTDWCSHLEWRGLACALTFFFGLLCIIAAVAVMAAEWRRGWLGSPGAMVGAMIGCAICVETPLLLYTPLPSFCLGAAP